MTPKERLILVAACVFLAALFVASYVLAHYYHIDLDRGWEHIDG